MVSINVENQQDFRLLNPQYVGDDIIIQLNYLRSEDGLRFFPANTQIVLENMAKSEWPFVQEKFGQKLKELENGDLLG